MSASPDSLSRMRLYFGFMCSALHHRHHFRGKVARLLLDAFADHEEPEGKQLRLSRRQHLFHALLVVLDERLPEERVVAEELVQSAFYHLGDDLGRLARLLRACRENAALTFDDIR